MYDNLNGLIEKSRQPLFRIGAYEFVSQQPKALEEKYRAASVVPLLPQFVSIWQAIEKATGHRWKNTSYIRDSPSHRRGQAFDLAPDIAPDSEQHYAVYNNSDPVLYKREKLIRQLQTLRHIDFSLSNANRIGIFIEPDHLHIQALAPDSSISYPTSIVKWKVEKPIYPDSKERMNLPLIKA